LDAKDEEAFAADFPSVITHDEHRKSEELKMMTTFLSPRAVPRTFDGTFVRLTSRDVSLLTAGRVLGALHLYSSYDVRLQHSDFNRE
jgi:hypothetical protein